MCTSDVILVCISDVPARSCNSSGVLMSCSGILTLQRLVRRVKPPVIPGAPLALVTLLALVTV